LEEQSFSKRHSLQVIFAVAIGTFMSALDSSIVNISLPVISNYFSISLTTVEWVVFSYLIIITSLLLTFGRLGDIYGHKKIYITGLIIFTAGSLFCALSPGIILLVASRIIQAAGAGMLMSLGPAIITINSPAKDRGKALGAIAVSVSVALIAGPVLGGLLTSYFGWQSIFYINVPVGIAALIWSIKILPVTKGQKKMPFDFAGAVTLFISLLAIIIPLSLADKFGWTNPFIISSIAAGAGLFVLFVFIEKKSSFPMLDLELFKNRLFTMSNIALLFNFVAQFAISIIMPFYLIQFRGMESSEAGLIMIAGPAVVMLIAPVAGYISDRTDTRYLSSAGMAVASAGLFLLGTLKADTPVWLIIFYLAVCGLGIGIFQTPNNSAIMGAVAPQYKGIASSMLATMRNLGMVLGAAFAGSIFSSRLKYLMSALEAQGTAKDAITNIAYPGAVRSAFIFAGVLASAAVIVSLVRGRQEKSA